MCKQFLLPLNTFFILYFSSSVVLSWNATYFIKFEMEVTKDLLSLQGTLYMWILPLDIINRLENSEWSNLAECPQEQINALVSALAHYAMLFGSQFEEMQSLLETIQFSMIPPQEKIAIILQHLKSNCVPKKRLLEALLHVRQMKQGSFLYFIYFIHRYTCI